MVPHFFAQDVALRCSPKLPFYPHFNRRALSDWWMRGQGHYCPGNKPDKLSTYTEENLRTSIFIIYQPRARRGCFPWRLLFARALARSVQRERERDNLAWMGMYFCGLAWVQIIEKGLLCPGSKCCWGAAVKAICASRLQIEHKSLNCSDGRTSMRRSPLLAWMQSKCSKRFYQIYGMARRHRRRI